MPSPTLIELRNAARGLLRSPTVSLSAILCLALGIGATAAISSAVSRALLQALPLRGADRLVAVHRTTPNSGPLGTWPQSVPNYLDLAAGTRRIEGLSAISQATALVQLGSDAVQASQLYVTGAFFQTIGATPARGRLLTPDDATREAASVAVLSDDFWKTKLGGDPAVLGRQINVDGKPTTVVGVLPSEFRVPHGGNVLHADIWMPLVFRSAQLGERRSNFLLLLGRLAPNATVTSAESELRGLFGQLIAAHPELKSENVRVAPLLSENQATVRTPLLLLFGAVCMVLLIAATNVAALLLARGVQRRRELAVRVALGATRWDAMRPALVESFIITAVGVICGLLLAVAGVRTIGALAAARLPQLAGLTLDARVLTFALALALVVAVACGAVPAWRGSAVDPQDALRGGRSAGSGRDHHRSLRSLVVAEISLSLILLIGAGLVLKGFMGLLHNDPGFETAHVLTMDLATSAQRYPNGTSVQRFLDPALTQVGAVPGVESATATSLVPYVNWGVNSNMQYEGAAADDPSHLPLVEQRVISPNFFAVTKQKLISGRTLRVSDNGDATSAAVVVVNEALVKRDFGGKDPVGKRFHLNVGDTAYGTIVGVVSNIRNMGPVSEPQPEMYWTWAQAFSGSTRFSLMIRTKSDDPASVVNAVRRAIHAIDPTAAVSNVQTMPEVIAKSLGRPRFYFSLLGTFAAVAMVLAIAGLYGTLSYTVAQRTREIGIRSALGSSQRGLIRLITWEGAKLVALGLLFGFIGGAAVTRLMTFMLYGVNPLDVTTWASAALLLGAAAIVATFIPAYRASHVDPLIAIRAE
ncbi:MAG TPA: ABC transporter permease [Gemmatimonadaceae bacterium]|jgi:predicted permease